MVEAFTDVWFIGDEFLKEAKASLKSIQLSSKHKKMVPLFIVEMFNIPNYNSNWGSRGLVKFLNPLIDALNEHPRLPKYIIIIPDRDFMKCIKEGEQNCSSIMIGACLHYIIRQYDCLINCRVQDLADKKIGITLQYLLHPKWNDTTTTTESICVEDKYPKLIWVRMIKRSKPLADNEQSLFNLRGKFNSILEERIADGKPHHHKIMSIEMRSDEFDRQGNLTSAGKSDFWREVDRAITKFNAGRITLLPHTSQTFNKNKASKKRTLTKESKIFSCSIHQAHHY